MVFSSTVFLFIFLPLVLAFYYLLGKKYRNTFLLLASLIFYTWGERKMVLLMIASIGLNYMAGIAISRFIADKIISKVIISLAILINLSFLAYYKYLNFALENLKWLGIYEPGDVPIVLLPIGISFYTFHNISYLIDVFRRRSQAQKNPFSLALYISFFPQLVAGPIIRYHDIEKQFASRNSTIKKFTDGILMFVIGLFKKVVLANTAGIIADHVFATGVKDIPSLVAWLGIICYALQIYFDFSGYSDMAIGLARMFGFRFPENFNHPYVSTSIREFWRRWHISLSSWFRDYLYIPLGGSKNGKANTYLNILLVFFVTGLWHGASWNFIIWGLFHGSFLILERSRIINLDKWPVVLKHIYVGLVILIGWVFFRLDTFAEAMAYLHNMLGLGTGNNYYPLIYVSNYTLIVLLTGLIFLAPFRKNFSLFLIKKQGMFTKPLLQSFSYFAALILLVLSSMELAASSYNPFIYFRF